MLNSIESLVQKLSDADIASTLNGIRRGIEKESLRIQPNGHLAQTPHPSGLGSALTHPSITTDYSEALLEFITPALTDTKEVLQYLTDIHQYVYSKLENEKLWVNSMPCIMGGDESIPIAQYGNSNSGRMKTIYRHGLWHRYGRMMQSISGMHYNFSLPQNFWQSYQIIKGNQEELQTFINTEYFNLVRNFQRFSWMPIYLFGASPAVCASFLRGRDHSLDSTESHTLYKPNATSLRMSDLGYQNDAQSDLVICYNHLDSYVDTLTHAIKTPHKAYEDIGVKVDEEYKQLNANILQIENEYYGSIRPKQTTQRGERPTQALQRRGVEYIEMRCVDLNPYNPIGIDETQINFLDLFAVFCLVAESRQFNPNEQKQIKTNLETIVLEGRDTKAPITIYEETHSIKEWGIKLCKEMQPIAQLFDQAYNTTAYSDALAQQTAKFEDPELTPSAQILNDIAQDESSFFHFAMDKALEHEAYFQSLPLNDETRSRFEAISKDSLESQTNMEANDDSSFEDYLANYFAD